MLETTPCTTNSAQGPLSPLGQVVITSDGSLTLSHPEHGECYHTKAGALAEARQLYVDSSGLAKLWQIGEQEVAVLDVGLGLGYTALVTLAAWAEAANPGDLTVVSLEINAALVTAMAGAAASWQANWPAAHLAFCRALRPVPVPEATAETAAPEAIWEAKMTHRSGRGRLLWRIVVADAGTSEVPLAPLPMPGGLYTHVWQDPFSPGKNPPLWQEAWFSRLRAVVRPDAWLMTYSVATAVRAALVATGWSWEKIPVTLPGKRKRHWLRARPVSPSEAMS